MLKVDTKCLDDDTPFELPEYSPIFLTFTIDQNEIFSVTFNISKTVKTLSSYSIPKLQAPFNIEKNAIGIDLGTSRCCVAVIRKNGITTVPLDNTGERFLPSYVSYDEENVKYGQIVVERLRNYSKSTIFDSKRIIGRKPIAAAFAYFNDRSISNNSNVLLFDLGGGTVDVCIFKIQNNQIEIISNTGDSKFVLHVGGGSRMPMIKQLLRNMFPEAEHCIEEHPDEVVAIGAAYYAYSLPSDS
uniref:Uncharacterized protein n=1 Tax=Panagrolaimus sp. PS1159 TaxID=55785 RepID=A0AC35FI13_9BILA